MNIWLRSFVFNILFYGWTLLCLLSLSPLFFFPSPYLWQGAKLWLRGFLWLKAHVLHLRFESIGTEKLPKAPFILASKHQSAWETFVLPLFLEQSVIVLKRELTWIPFFGWYLKKIGVIPLSRSKKHGTQSLKQLLAEAEKAKDRGVSILIFPEGTRSSPGAEAVYRSGVASLYLHLNIPVVPIALNSGLFWPRRSFLKYPGVIRVSFLDPIAPGLSRHAFMVKLQDEIESTTKTLIKGGRSYGKKA